MGESYHRAPALAQPPFSVTESRRPRPPYISLTLASLAILAALSPSRVTPQRPPHAWRSLTNAMASLTNPVASPTNPVVSLMNPVASLMNAVASLMNRCLVAAYCGKTLHKDKAPSGCPLSVHARNCAGLPPF
jgi:hypothetical protein